MRTRRKLVAVPFFILIVTMISFWMSYSLFMDTRGSLQVHASISIMEGKDVTEPQIMRRQFQSFDTPVPKPDHTTISELNNTSPNKSDHTGNFSSECPGLMPPLNFRDKQKWLPVDNENRMFVFSAYYDEIDGKPYIRLIGLGKDRSQLFFCQLWFNTRHSKHNFLAIIMGKTTLIADVSSTRYQEVYLLCPLPNDDVPYAVSAVSTKCQEPLNSLPVQPWTQQAEVKRNFTVCVSPLNMNYSRAYEIVEWLELNIILGADYFFIYNYSSAFNIGKVMKLYSDRGIVEVIQWPLFMHVDTWPPSYQTPEVKYFGQKAALNDCLYRSRPYTKFLINVDVDEFIIPRGNRSYKWVDMLKQLPEASGYIIRHTFFRKDWPDYRGANTKSLVSASYINDIEGYNLVTLKKLQRESGILPGGQRSKYIVKVNDAVSITIHDIWQYRKGQHSHVVGPSVGLLHHYRNWFKPREGTRVLDTRMLLYQDKLVHQIRSIWSKLEGVPLDLLTVDKNL
ncbi:hypothetical protein CHS0354_034775 [Potamilus streckersoni]|uniref:Glycosyltransferase family 92 protein n=1 Tax=Potamilus streckersoni TaxID=2493646 RepID=A0AAE0RSU7_9BIVA|nr:hypothetical protein CHS0354_034775 [Potamilus streckersoni]